MMLASWVALAASWSGTSVRVPDGHFVPAECITRLQNNETYDASSTEPAVECDRSAIQSSSPSVQIYAADVHFKSTVPLTSFTADWVVPPLPTHHSKLFGQVVYFWPGFKASAPEMGFPVLQPVLQYGEHGPAWALQSWFVDAKDPNFPVVTAPAIDVFPGHHITSFMQLSDDGLTWTVSGTNQNTGQHSTLHVAYSRAGKTNYDYAMLVNENIGVNSKCDRMPASNSLTFSNISVNGDKMPNWTTRANCAGNPQCDCGNTASVASNGAVTLGWRSSVK